MINSNQHLYLSTKKAPEGQEVIMLSEIKIWLLVAVAGSMSTVLGFVIKVVTGQVIKRLDDIVTELKQLSQSTTIQGQQIKGLQEQDSLLHSRLNEHGMRIHTLEMKETNK